MHSKKNAEIMAVAQIQLSFPRVIVNKRLKMHIDLSILQLRLLNPIYGIVTTYR